MSSAGAIGYFNFKMVNWVPRGREGKQCLKYLNTLRFKSNLDVRANYELGRSGQK